MVSALDIGHGPGGSAKQALHHVQTGRRVLLQLGLVPLAVSALHVVVQVLVIQLLDNFQLVHSLDDQVVLLSQRSLCSQFSEDETHQMLLFTLDGGAELSEVQPVGLGGSQTPHLRVLLARFGAASDEPLVFLGDHLGDSVQQLLVLVLDMTLHLVQRDHLRHV